MQNTPVMQKMSNYANYANKCQLCTKNALHNFEGSGNNHCNK